jgi:hypothetical protein
MIGHRYRLGHLHHHMAHVSCLFPSDTNLTCTLTALNTANTFSDWAEIQDSGATKLSTAFATSVGHISAMLVETISEADTIYILEIAWGADKTVLLRSRFAGGTKFQSPATHTEFNAPWFPAGQLIYYRMKTASAVADTCTVHFRYHVHD